MAKSLTDPSFYHQKNVIYTYKKINSSYYTKKWPILICLKIYVYYNNNVHNGDWNKLANFSSFEN